MSKLDNFCFTRPMEIGFYRDTPFRMCEKDDPTLLLWNKLVEKLCNSYPHKKEVGIMGGPPAFHCRYTHYFGVKDGLLQSFYTTGDVGQGWGASYEESINGMKYYTLKELDNKLNKDE